MSVETANNLLTINVGSSSLKWALFDEKLTSIAEGNIEGIGSQVQSHVEAAQSVLKQVGPIKAIGHRIVHGGALFTKPTRITPTVLGQLHDLIPFSPLHLPAEIEVIESCKETKCEQVGCFDTAFHQKMPSLHKRFPLDTSLYKEGVKRYGFHGLSYEYILSQVKDQVRGQKVIIAHLGSGASMVAVVDGKPIDTTMGFSPAGGIMMATRCGDLDPGVFLYLMREKGYGVSQLQALIYHQSGLRGISEKSADMKELLAIRSSNKQADMAISLFCYHARKAIGALTATMGGLDAIIFTGGIGVHAKEIREEICQPLAFLCPKENIHMLPTDENRMIAQHTRELIKAT